jgi:hypothetical protein
VKEEGRDRSGLGIWAALRIVSAISLSHQSRSAAHSVVAPRTPISTSSARNWSGPLYRVVLNQSSRASAQLIADVSKPSALATAAPVTVVTRGPRLATGPAWVLRGDGS